MAHKTLVMGLALLLAAVPFTHAQNSSLAEADALYQALTMPLEEQQKRMRKLRAQVSEQNIYRWAGKVLSTLLKFEFPDT